MRMSDDRADRFHAFLKTWETENVVALLDRHIDPSERAYLVQQEAKRLAEAAREQGMLNLFYEEVGSRTLVLDYVNGLFEAAESRKQSGMT
jgi:hypothetical protein